MNGRPRSGSEHGNAWVMFLDQGHYRLSPRVQMWKSILANIPRSRRRRHQPRRGGSRNPNLYRHKNITSRREQGDDDGEGQLSYPPMMLGVVF